ncbi:hypothetical protein H9Q72_001939 [Fusarium xylarioides]|uniref:Uncharacterized protein n=1 Tax=Fusarium xylarioides TaxID=221167 RepID=A0A9P7ILT2_9HYPO|nr:hypothetical protein H9Q70_014233 [Fusarium xylarioides]KAG5771499.1 hypothetical protein H9Q72_001939 [Fusarium xylarioides]KAG5805163.1 hypothetical protein H9Q71_010269 [Fusarium xylarioides]KAG5818841.1 hypothetical protein H9Q74_009829 [Fusarium xylarioides]
MQKPKGKRTTRPWPSGLTVPGARAVRRLPADPSAKYTIIKIPNASTAFSSWPTLNKFKSALQPRTSGTIPPGASAGVQATVDTDMEMAILPYLYNDLGVLIFEGPQWEQVRIMANILQSVECEECRLPKRDWTTGNASFEVNYDKWNVYRIKLNQWKHTEITFQKYRKKHTITPKGLYGLTNIALKKWKADGIGGPVPVETVPGSIKMYLVKHIDGPGLANHTINGSYLPQLHVYVATGIRGSTIYMSIEFHTVGTRRLVGVTNLNLKPISEISSTKDTAEKPPKGVDRNTHFDQKFASVEEKLKAGGKGDTYSLKQASQPPPTHARSIETPRELYKRLVPSNTTRNSEIYRLAMFKLYKLEHKLWAQRKRTVGKERKDERRITNFTERHKERLAAVARMEEKYLDANGEA